MKLMYLGLCAMVVGCIFLAGCFAAVGQSTLIIAVKDAPKTPDLGTISSLNVTIREVSVHRANASEPVNENVEEMEATEAEGTGTSGWIVVVDQPQTVDLIQLTNVSKVIGQETMEAGNYTQIRLAIESGTITIDDEEYNLAVPSGVLKLNRGFTLVPDQTLTLTLDFNVERSIVRTGAGQFKLQPVIAVLAG